MKPMEYMNELEITALRYSQYPGSLSGAMLDV